MRSVNAVEPVDRTGVGALEHDFAARVRGCDELQQRAQSCAGPLCLGPAPVVHGTPGGIGANSARRWPAHSSTTLNVRREKLCGASRSSTSDCVLPVSFNDHDAASSAGAGK